MTPVSLWILLGGASKMMVVLLENKANCISFIHSKDLLDQRSCFSGKIISTVLFLTRGLSSTDFFLQVPHLVPHIGHYNVSSWSRSSALLFVSDHGNMQLLQSGLCEMVELDWNSVKFCWSLGGKSFTLALLRLSLLSLAVTTSMKVDNFSLSSHLLVSPTSPPINDLKLGATTLIWRGQILGCWNFNIFSSYI